MQKRQTRSTTDASGGSPQRSNTQSEVEEDPSSSRYVPAQPQLTPAPIDAVFIVGDTDMSIDPYCINVARGSQHIYQRGMWEFFQANPSICNSLITSTQLVPAGTQVSASITPDGAHSKSLPLTFAVSDSSFLILLIVRHLIQMLANGGDERRHQLLHVAFVPASSYKMALKDKINGKSQRRDPRKEQQLTNTRSHVHVYAPSPIRVAPESGSWRQKDLVDSPVLAAWTTWPALATHPVRTIYLPSIMHFSDLGHHSQLRSAEDDVAREHGAAAYVPSLDFEQLIEHKEQVWSALKRFMLPTTWVDVPLAPLASRGRLQAKMQEATAEEVSKTLLTGVRDGSYVIKGGYSFGAMCTKIIEVCQGQRPSLVPDILQFRESYHQSAIGLQRFIPDFKDHEFRFWYFALPVLRSPLSDSLALSREQAPLPQAASLSSSVLCWDRKFCLRTHSGSESGKGGIVAVPEFSDRPIPRACQEWADMVASSDFAQDVLQKGMKSLRIDCGYDAETGKPFFSEFATAPSGYLWTEVHHAESIVVVAENLAETIMIHCPNQHQSSPSLSCRKVSAAVSHAIYVHLATSVSASPASAASAAAASAAAAAAARDDGQAMGDWLPECSVISEGSRDFSREDSQRKVPIRADADGDAAAMPTETSSLVTDPQHVASDSSVPFTSAVLISTSTSGRGASPPSMSLQAAALESVPPHASPILPSVSPSSSSALFYAPSSSAAPSKKRCGPTLFNSSKSSAVVADYVPIPLNAIDSQDDSDVEEIAYDRFAGGSNRERKRRRQQLRSAAAEVKQERDVGQHAPMTQRTVEKHARPVLQQLQQIQDHFQYVEQRQQIQQMQQMQLMQQVHQMQLQYMQQMQLHLSLPCMQPTGIAVLQGFLPTQQSLFPLDISSAVVPQQAPSYTVPRYTPAWLWARVHTLATLFRSKPCELRARLLDDVSLSALRAGLRSLGEELGLQGQPLYLHVLSLGDTRFKEVIRETGLL
jgi:hypothetical protein